MNKNDDAATATGPAIEIRFGQVSLAQVRIRTTDPGAILDELTGRVAAAPRFFERTPVCLDLGALEHDPEVEQVRAVLDAVRRAGMVPVGIAHGTDAIEALAPRVALPVMTQLRSPVRPAPAQQKEQSPEPEPAAPHAVALEMRAPALMHHRPVRSGQRLYARDRDLVVTAPVGAGAEVMADGCVHIYGSLRGRAMAGARGETTARVFCQEFNAELVSIAGVFRVFESIPPELAGQPVQAWLDGDDLRFARIGSR
jgi:septum site-determining protein MinC